MPGFAEYWNLDVTLRSRENEDKSIYYTFFRQLSRENMMHYRYVELGAFDGVQESNSRFFDLCLGWEGLLIEPNPRIYPDLTRNRPHAHRMSFAASCSEADAAADKTVGFWASAFTNAAQDESVNRGAYANKTKLLQQVPCGSLTPVLLDLFPDGKIHFFSLDTEGTEDKVLANIDFNRISIGALISENRNKFCLETCAARENTRALMKSLGYKLYAETIPFSDLFVHPQSEFADMVAEE
jgi:Methyltransferase FkbM domain